MTTACVLFLHHKLNKRPTTIKQLGLHIVNVLTLSTPTQHVFNVSAVLSHCELHTTIPFTNVLATTEFRLLMKIIAPTLE